MLIVRSPSRSFAAQQIVIAAATTDRAQLSRAIENRHPRTPMLSDLRDSGSIEQDADIVMFLSREEMYTTPEQWAEQHPDLPLSAYPKGVADVQVAKHRNGPTGRVLLSFDKANQRIGEWA